MPIDLGGSGVTSIHMMTYAALRAHLGLPARPMPRTADVQQLALVDEDVQDILADVISVGANRSPSYTPVLVDEPGGSVSYKDEFGAALRKPAGGFYFDWQEFPLAEPPLVALERCPGPTRLIRRATPGCASGCAGCARARHTPRRRSSTTVAVQ